MATGNAVCTILGRKYWNGGWVDYGAGSGSGYAGTNYTTYYAYILKFTIPAFTGVSERLSFKLGIGKQQGTAPTLRYALCSSEANLDLYANTNAQVTDSNQIVSGTITAPTLVQGINYWEFSIPTARITKGGTYYLFLWGYAPQSAPESITVYGMEYHSVSFAYNSGLIRIDTGTEIKSFQVCIDNGSSWDVFAPYADNGNAYTAYG